MAVNDKSKPRRWISDFIRSINSKINLSDNAPPSHANKVLQRRQISSLYSWDVPLDKSLLDFAASEVGVTGVGTVLVLNTGGGIGMQKEDGVYKPIQHFLTNYLMQTPIFNDSKFWERAPAPRRSESSVSSQLQTKMPSTVSAPLVMPLNEDGRRIIYRLLEYNTLLDSSDCSLEVWVNLALDLERFYDYFDGFVILHGTDTLPYAASALSFILENLAKPIVMTGSELPIDRLRNDGRHNLLGSLLIAGGGYDIPEVTVFAQNELHRGNRVVKRASTDLVAFTTPNSEPLVEMKEEVHVHHDRIWRRNKQISKRLTVQTNLCTDVAVFRLFPLISVDSVKCFFKPPMKGVILQTYGTGNVPSNNEELIKIFKEAYDVHKIVLFNVTQCWKGSVVGVYETGAILGKLGAISGCDITTEAALMKMAYVLGKWSDIGTQRRMLAHSLRGEMTEPFVETRLHRRSSMSRGLGVESSASMATTTGLGYVFVNAENAGLSSLWSGILFHSLMCASVVNDDAEVLEQLLRIAGHFEYPDNRHVYPLHVAAGAGSLTSCRIMLENGANANVVDKCGLTPLSWAVQGPNATLALIALMRRYDCRFSSIASARARETNVAASAGKIHQLRLYRFAGLSLEEVDAEGRAPLHAAVVHHQTDTIRYLITSYRASTILGEGIESMNGAELLELGGAGVDPAQPTGYGTTALEEAKERGFQDIVEILEHALEAR